MTVDMTQTPTEELEQDPDSESSTDYLESAMGMDITQTPNDEFGQDVDVDVDVDLDLDLESESSSDYPDLESLPDITSESYQKLPEADKIEVKVTMYNRIMVSTCTCEHPQQYKVQRKQTSQGTVQSYIVRIKKMFYFF